MSLPNINDVRKGIDVRNPLPENIYDQSFRCVVEKPDSTPSSTVTESAVEERSMKTYPLYNPNNIFSFHQTFNDEEIKKCVSFWQSVVKENMKSIKLSFIDFSMDKTSKVKENVSMKNVEEDIRKTHKSHEALWVEALRQVGEEGFKDVKLINEKGCAFCKYLELPVDYEGENEMNLEELNDWKPPPPKPPPQKPTKVKDEEVIFQSKLEADKFKYVNVVEEKKKRRLYQQWRTDVTCRCGLMKKIYFPKI